MTLDLATQLSPPNSLVLIVASEHPDIPILDGVLVASTDTCIAVGTLMELDGETEVRITDGQERTSGLEAAFEAALRTDEGFIAVRTVDGREVLRHEVAGKSQQIRVWVSDASEPDKIVLELVGHR
jgi:hypothetical protein